MDNLLYAYFWFRIISKIKNVASLHERVHWMEIEPLRCAWKFFPVQQTFLAITLINLDFYTYQNIIKSLSKKYEVLARIKKRSIVGWNSLVSS